MNMNYGPSWRGPGQGWSGPTKPAIQMTQNAKPPGTQYGAFNVQSLPQKYEEDGFWSSFGRPKPPQRPPGSFFQEGAGGGWMTPGNANYGGSQPMMLRGGGGPGGWPGNNPFSRPTSTGQYGTVPQHQPPWHLVMPHQNQPPAPPQMPPWTPRQTPVIARR